MLQNNESLSSYLSIFYQKFIRGFIQFYALVMPSGVHCRKISLAHSNSSEKWIQYLRRYYMNRSLKIASQISESLIRIVQVEISEMNGKCNFPGQVSWKLSTFSHFITCCRCALFAAGHIYSRVLCLCIWIAVYSAHACILHIYIVFCGLSKLGTQRVARWASNSNATEGFVTRKNLSRSIHVKKNEIRLRSTDKHSIKWTRATWV